MNPSLAALRCISGSSPLQNPAGAQRSVQQSSSSCDACEQHCPTHLDGGCWGEHCTMRDAQLCYARPRWSSGGHCLADMRLWAAFRGCCLANCAPTQDVAASGGLSYAQRVGIWGLGLILRA